MIRSAKKQQRFRNLAQLPSNSYQLKFKWSKREFQPVCTSLLNALETRNAIYLKDGYRPNFLFVKLVDMSIVSKRNSNGIYDFVDHYFIVNSHRLRDRKKRVKQTMCETEANRFAEGYVKSHNMIAKLYNQRREELFLFQMQEEIELLTPRIATGFDIKLWYKAAQQLMTKIDLQYW